MLVFYFILIFFLLYCDFLSTMVSFGSAPLEKNQSGRVPNPEPLTKPILDAISQVVVMSTKKHTYSCEKKGKSNLLHVIFFPLLLSTNHILLR